MALMTTSRIRILILALLAFVLPSPAWSQPYTLSPDPAQEIRNASGVIVASGCLSTFLTGTTTRETTYSTSSGTAHANPIIASSDGKIPAVFLQPGVSYRFRYENVPCSAASPGATLRTVDGIAAVPTSGLNVDVTGTAGETLTLNDLVYLSDGSGGLDAGEWYRADADNAYSSIAATNVGFATAAAAANATVIVRIAGRMTGLTLSAGSIYYASATAAAITSTRPAMAVCVGKADSTTTLVLPCGPRADTGSSMALLRAASGTTTNAAAENVDTVAISGLTALDTLVVEYTMASATQQTTTPRIYNTTDAVVVGNLLAAGGSLVAGTSSNGTAKVRQRQSAATAVFCTAVEGRSSGAIGGEGNAATFTTAWTGSWTLALRHEGVTAGGTFQWSWAVYVVRGQ